MVATTTSSSMEAASRVNLPTAPAAAVIAEQPKPNTMLPLPTTTTTTNTNDLNQLDVQEEQEAGVGLRGGWMTIGKHFNCCGLNCGFSKTF
ncbi:hypothetical protein GE21DRAFT_10655 [Neurospora crassa]|uniref:Uncharacterized protein n=1 Tax=Neurospora crassa (strain ATCC 24698 / 74-OR23-1A / CBS 708.71 / DSM 1257 / FGSC 987) TaxID=367110 RepID=Q7S5Q7_NEUCR|nr:hypothetical protein NCU05786 [Neurospora crassa OR74A]EAA30810.1 hypothetical protein NCU05786 [Neurospora crassa OR74A]KHE86632.1 hypothetical protein GE21DRAFT_10655 [Neurospora crassa]|eukprot:XP_960046.1 hypothetical protein NCU05786 [Neurospora crassa OR74A]